MGSSSSGSGRGNELTYGIPELMARCTVPRIKPAKARYPFFKENVEYS
jgi:hypothetical protein